MREILQRLSSKEPEVLWALVTIVVGYAIWGWLAGRRAAQTTAGLPDTRAGDDADAAEDAAEEARPPG